MKLQIRGGRVIDPANGIDEVTDLFIAYGRITALGQAPDGYFPDRVIEARHRQRILRSSFRRCRRYR